MAQKSVSDHVLGKTRIDELAVLKGKPMFSTPLHVGTPNLGNRDAFHRRLQSILDSKRFTNDGPLVREFEDRTAELLGVEHEIATCNATTGLLLTMRAMELDGEVITPSFNFVAAAHATQFLGLKPVFCDVDPRTHNLDPKAAEDLISGKTCAIIPVHLWGRPCIPDDLECLAARYGLQLLFDSAHAFGCAYRSRFVGGFGDAEVFSFHPPSTSTRLKVE